MNDNHYKIAIIGGGASGLMLAANLDLCGAEGILLEGSGRLGTKLLMSGGGHCNITHGGSIKDFVHSYGDEGKELRRCLYRHSNLDLARWFCDHGVPLADENGETVELSYGSAGIENEGRIFPGSMRSRDVLDALVNETSCNGWQIETSAKVIGLRTIGDDRSHADISRMCRGAGADSAEYDEKLWEITLENEYELTASNVVVAAGGITYPETGSDGSMLELLEDLGLDVTEPGPALAPVYVKDYPYAELSGISLPDVTVIAFRSDSAGARGGKSAKMKGDLLFTHEGLSGPVILNISGYVEPGERIRLCYNKEFSELPRRMQKVLRDRARGPLGDVKTNILASFLNQDDFVVERVDERGMVTAGGVSLDELELSTMRVKRFAAGTAGESSVGAAVENIDEVAGGAAVENIDEVAGGAAVENAGENAGENSGGLYVIGEALDADGITGGYNLQLCWSTACAAADDLRSKLKLE